MTATAPPLHLSDVNTMDEEAFVAAFGAVYEHSPWVARVAGRERPFADVDALRAALEDAMRAAPRERQMALIRAHPELAGREADAGDLTDESASEQASAGLDRLTAGEYAELQLLNRSYGERFGFPFVVCVRHLTKDEILARGRERLQRSREQEVETALGEIAKIAKARLRDLVA
jgi:OHCU decarboxylase